MRAPRIDPESLLARFLALLDHPRARGCSSGTPRECLNASLDGLKDAPNASQECPGCSKEHPGESYIIPRGGPSHPRIFNLAKVARKNAVVKTLISPRVCFRSKPRGPAPSLQYALVSQLMQVHALRGCAILVRLAGFSDTNAPVQHLTCALPLAKMAWTIPSSSFRSGRFCKPLIATN